MAYKYAKKNIKKQQAQEEQMLQQTQETTSEPMPEPTDALEAAIIKGVDDNLPKIKAEVMRQAKVAQDFYANHCRFSKLAEGILELHGSKAKAESILSEDPAIVELQTLADQLHTTIQNADIKIGDMEYALYDPQGAYRAAYHEIVQQIKKLKDLAAFNGIDHKIGQIAKDIQGVPNWETYLGLIKHAQTKITISQYINQSKSQ